ncbi:hypothetical protein ACFPOD_04835 [Nitratireductor kimnyeongensis]|uniref:Minor tail protein n=1 Tax=Nitratireductor kimnyeongensis TaxID=430679 RepID=A0ABW0T5H9_9HYPH|nr:hypothetical protein [Nitratireductor kimnyeongensis]QZZ34590.1 hypothetical protein KW403_12360 [Nitratireductor kimnyeongensis]
MPLDIDASYYKTGTATVAADDTAVTGQGTSWAQSVRPGDLFGTHVGDPVRIASVNSNTSLTLAYPWKGPAQTAAAYEIQFTPYDTGYQAAVRELLQMLASGNVEALAGLVGAAGTFPIFTGPGAMDLADLSDYAGDVVGPTSSTDSNVALFDGATGKLLKDGFPAGTTGKAVLAAGSTGAAQDAIGASSTGKSLLTAASASAARSTLGLASIGGMRNKLINPLGVVNQRDYTSGATTSSANQYTVDRWRVVASGQSLSWTQAAGVRTFTAPAGGVEQVIEGGAILSGTYTLNWEGTATATVNGVARAKGESFPLTGGANVTVRFSAGTFSKPQLEVGSSPTEFEVRHPGLELELCQWYYRRVKASDSASNWCRFGTGVCSTNSLSHVIIPWNMMRVNGSLEISNETHFTISKSVGVTGSITFSLSDLSNGSFGLSWNSPAGSFAAGEGAILLAYNNKLAWIARDAEL